MVLSSNIGQTINIPGIATASISTFTVSQFQSPLLTNTPRPTFTPTRTPRPTFIPTATPSPQPTSTFTPSPTPVGTSTPTPMPSPTFTLIPTETPTATDTPLPTEPLPTRPTFTPILTASPTLTPTQPPTATPTSQPTPLAGVNEIVSRVPILMYHYISVPPAQADIYRQDLSVTPKNFELQLAYLRKQGFTSISPETLIYHLGGHKPLPTKPVLLTFDDGYADNYTYAFPLLKRYGFRGTFSLVTESINFNDPNYLSWDQVVEMHRTGMDFGAHTRRHPDLRNQSLDFLRDEIIGSKEDIEAYINEPVRFFVYPSGHYDLNTLQIVQEADFWLAVTTQYGYEHRHDKRFILPRVRIHGADTLVQFIAKVEAAVAK